MEVFMRVQVSRLNTPVNNRSNLGGKLDLDSLEDFFVHKSFERKFISGVFELAGVVEQRFNNTIRRERFSIRDIQVNADTEGWSLFRNRYSLIRGGRICHNSCAGKNTAGVSLDDGSVDTFAESEIIGIYNQFYKKSTYE